MKIKILWRTVGFSKGFFCDNRCNSIHMPAYDTKG